ncbi:MAG: ABC transporter ATP-binding protein [Clostridiales bacterium]|uniref:ABC transporter ATP-binding protein n=1 Tax=Robinsoniella sp. TaxID=2496533 RepID=UPI00290F7AB8|nr:ABC transporter ATP-binding protein [Clostridiales bacterium]MDU3240420.1 ABC transporter ATP-binding protein [Clostridiales bacterium]
MDEIAIKVEDLTKIYKLYDKPTDRLKESLGLSRNKVLSRDHYALQHVSFDVKKGETIGIIGTNGSGKSTILKIITGVLNPTGGNLTVNGRISALLELGAGFNMEYTGIENIYLNGTMIGFTREEIEKKIDDILEFADIGEFIYQPVKTYSSGMFVRLAFAVAINIEPEILIVDEALSVGDVFFQTKCYRKFEDFKKMGKTILLVSHDLSSISKYCDRVILLNKGKKLAEGVPKQMVDMYKKVLVNQLDLDDQGKLTEVVPEKKTVLAADIENQEEWSPSFDVNPHINEYGDKKAEIIGFNIIDEKGLSSNTIEKGSTCTIKMRVKFHDKINDPIYAFTITDLKGTDVTGTNSLFEKVNVQSKGPGEYQEIAFTQRMDMQGGEYMLSLGCTGYDQVDFVVHHRLYEVCNLTIVSTKNTVGFYDANSKVALLN